MKIKFNDCERLFEPAMMSDVELFLTHNDHNFQLDYESAMEWKSFDPCDTEWIWSEDNHENVVDTIKELAGFYIDENIG